MIASFALVGCVYQLPVLTPPSQLHTRIIGSSDKSYVLRLHIGQDREYQVPADGRVSLDIPPYRAGCDVYLFGIRIQRGADPLTEKTLDLVVDGKLATQISLKQLAALSTDPEGYHLLNVPTRSGR